MTLDDLPTPCLLVERSRLDRNLQKMQKKAGANGVSLRPHVKTHKSFALARCQREKGADGITVAKVSEAERFVEAGFDDVRIAYAVIGDAKYDRIARLDEKADISFCIDTRQGAIAASSFFADRDRSVQIFLEVNTGHNRCGVDPESERAVELAREISDLPGLQLAGILTHAGQAYHGPHEGETREEALRRVSNHERDAMLQFAARLGRAGLADPDYFQISVGSTPTMRFFSNAELDGFRVTEIRPGNYVFHDAMQHALGVVDLSDCALTVLTTIISRHRDRSGRDRLFGDAGKKVLTSDTGALTDGFGILLYNARTMHPMPHARITGLSEEHAWIDVSGGSTLDVGSRVRIVPNHACVTVSTRDEMYVVDGDNVVDTWSVDARGAVA